QPINQFNVGSVSRPINFVPLYSGSSETTQPSPNIGTIVGYGNTGGGQFGESPDTGGTKRGGLVLVDPTTKVIDNQTVLTSQFLNRGQLFNKGLPSNFVEGNVGTGDSGGGLFQNIGANGALVQTGVISSVNTMADKYGTEARYTRISAYASWIQAAAASFGPVVPSNLGTTPTSAYTPLQNTLVASQNIQNFILPVLAGVPIYIDPSGGTLEY